MSAQPAPERRSPGQRGERRRRAILEAAIRILGTSGPAGLTHRAVAREAGVPLAATTYYFASKEALLEEALRLLAGEEADRLEAEAAAFRSAGATDVDGLARALAAFVAERLRSERTQIVAKFEVYLEASRRESLRAPSRHWIDAFTRMAESALAAAGARDPAGAARLLVAAVDGLVLQHLACSGPSPEIGEMEQRLRALLEALARAEPTGPARCRSPEAARHPW